MAAIVVMLFVVDHPRLYRSYRNQMVTLDSAVTDEAELTSRLEALLGGEVVKMKVKRVDLVNDTTVVDVRYKLPTLAGSGVVSSVLDPLPDVLAAHLARRVERARRTPHTYRPQVHRHERTAGAAHRVEPSAPGHARHRGSARVLLRIGLLRHRRPPPLSRRCDESTLPVQGAHADLPGHGDRDARSEVQGWAWPHRQEPTRLLRRRPTPAHRRRPRLDRRTRRTAWCGGDVAAGAHDRLSTLDPRRRRSTVPATRSTEG